MGHDWEEGEISLHVSCLTTVVNKDTCTAARDRVPGSPAASLDLCMLWLQWPNWLYASDT